VSLAIFNVVELNLHPVPCPRYSLFVLITDVNLPTNQPVIFNMHLKADGQTA